MPFNEIWSAAPACRVGRAHPRPAGVDRLPAHHAGKRKYEPHLLSPVFLEHNAELKPDIEAGTTDQMLTLVRSDLGLAFVPGRWPAATCITSICRWYQGGYPSLSVLPGLRPRRRHTAAREFRHQLLESAKTNKK